MKPLTLPKLCQQTPFQDFFLTLKECELIDIRRKKGRSRLIINKTVQIITNAVWKKPYFLVSSETRSIKSITLSAISFNYESHLKAVFKPYLSRFTKLLLVNTQMQIYRGMPKIKSEPLTGKHQKALSVGAKAPI